MTEDPFVLGKFNRAEYRLMELDYAIAIPHQFRWIVRQQE